MEMSGLNWNCTPPEILRSICEHLDPPDLKTLRLANKQMYFAASPLLFRTIYIHVLSREQLRLDVDHLIDQLTRSYSFNSVQHLRVEGGLSRERDDDGKLRHGPVPHWKEECRLTPRWHWQNRFAYHEDLAVHRIRDDDSAWLPLARLIALIPNLQDVVFASKNQFSPCLLEALRRNHSLKCRLHLEPFCLRSVNAPVMQDYEYQLMTSPYLEGIATEHYEDVRVVLALAPMLRSLYMICNPPTASPENFRLASQQSSLTTRPVSFHGHKDIKRLCPLTRLQFCQERFDEAWDEIVDLSVLRILILDKPIEQRMLSWLAAKAPFKSLTELEVPFDCWDQPNSRKSYTEAFASFIQSVSPLQSLCIQANPLTSDIFTAILDQHGTSLHTLSLITFGHLESLRLDALQIEKLSRQCPSIRELAITTPRSKGDDAEQAIYTALGSMSQLRRLRLGLDCQNRTCLRMLPNGEAEIFSDPSWDDFSRQLFPVEGNAIEVNPRNGHVIDMLINCALDANLAEEIYWCISSGKVLGAKRLKSLHLFVKGGGFFGEPNLHFPADAVGVLEVVSRIAKVWSLEIGIMGKLEVKEMDRRDEWNNGLDLMTWIRLNESNQDILVPQVEPVSLNLPQDILYYFSL